MQARLPYIDAVRTLGLSSPGSWLATSSRTSRPRSLATFLLDFVGALIVFSSLAFLGIGLEPGSADWGTMLAAGKELLFVNPWLLLGPGIAIVVTAASVTLLGDWAYERMSERDSVTTVSLPDSDHAKPSARTGASLIVEGARLAADAAKGRAHTGPESELQARAGETLGAGG